MSFVADKPASTLIADITGPRKLPAQHKPKGPVRLPESSVAFCVFLLVNVTLFLRPAELIPALLGLPIYEVLILTALALSFKRLQWQFQWPNLRRQPISLCVLGLLPAVVLSHATHAYLYGMKDSGLTYLKLLVYYGLIVTLIDSPQRLRWFLLTIATCASAMITLCVVDYLGVHDFEFIKHLDTIEGVDVANLEQVVLRMRGTGIFQDPNDLATLIAATSVLCLYFLCERSRFGARFLWLLPLAILGVGLVCTRSRGGLLAVGAAVIVLVGIRYGKRVAAGSAVVGLGLLQFIAGRQGEFELDNGTGYDRITLWREGYESLKSAEIVFGIGQGEYSEIARLVAHNSYVHAFVELGLFGGTLFFGCFFFAGLGLYRLHRAGRLTNPELDRLRPYLCALLAGWCAAMLSLSRCYVVPTYLVIGLIASYLTMASKHATPPRLFVVWNARHRRMLVAASLATFLLFYLVVKVLA